MNKMRKERRKRQLDRIKAMEAKFFNVFKSATVAPNDSHNEEYKIVIHSEHHPDHLESSKLSASYRVVSRERSRIELDPLDQHKARL
jgi:hypothetical protein